MSDDPKQIYISGRDSDKTSNLANSISFAANKHQSSGGIVVKLDSYCAARDVLHSSQFCGVYFLRELLTIHAVPRQTGFRESDKNSENLPAGSQAPTRPTAYIRIPLLSIRDPQVDMLPLSCPRSRRRNTTR